MPNHRALSTLRCGLISIVILGGVLSLCPFEAVQAASALEALYDEKADTRADIADAVAQAQKENKRVLVIWGGNWCGWCHRLHDTFENNAEISAYLNAHYVRVLSDTASNNALMKEMNVVPKGVPYLTVLDSDGKKIIDQDTDSLETGSKHDPAKVMAFLKRHIPDGEASPKSAAATQFNAALAALPDDQKRLFVKFSTPSCGWCRHLDAFLKDDAIAPMLAKDYRFLEIDQANLDGGSALRMHLAGPKPVGGVPWYAIVDKRGHVVTTATGPEGNIGYPVGHAGIAHFMTMIRGSASTLEEQDFAVVESKLKERAKHFGY